MKITLRKASALQSAVSNLIGEIYARPVVSVDDESILAEEVAQAKEDYGTNLRRLRSLIEVKFSLRKAIGEMNHTSGVTGLLTQERETTELMSELENVVERVNGRYFTVEQMQAKFDKHNQRVALSGSSYMSRSISVDTDLISKEEVAELRKEMLSLKRKRQAVNDRVLEINVSTHITLTDEEEKILMDEGLI